MSFPPELKERLASVNDDWQRTVRTSGDDLPPDGDYQAIVERFEPFQAKSSGAYWLKTELRIQLDPDWDGKIVTTIHALDDPARAEFLVRHLRTLGISGDALEDLSNIDQALHTVLDVPVRIAVVTADRINEKTGLPFRNVYVNERLGPPLTSQARSDVPAEQPAQPAAAGAVAADDEPELPF